MRNIFINSYRKKTKQNVVSDDSTNDFLLNHNQLIVSNSAESRLKIKEIQSAIHHLPNIFRQPFLLYFDGYKYFEISEILKEPLGTIKSRIHFARKLLKEQISRF
jgi:RNA polymerase sigma-70 factor (ECF subfamily)